ncbi:bacterio-opsin activator domain-containing protein [Halobacteriaceae archaeon GCM10025711]
MLVIADVTVPAEALSLGTVLTTHPDATVEFERFVPLDDPPMPLVWVDTDDPDAVESTLASLPSVASVVLLTTVSGRTLFEMHWRRDADLFVSALADLPVRLLRIRGHGGSWRLRLQFRDRDHLTAFRTLCRERDISFSLQRLFHPTLPTAGGTLSPEQRDTILTAYEHGYFEVPRGVTLAELGAMLGISDNAASQRLRRGLASLVAETMVEEPL